MPNYRAQIYASGREKFEQWFERVYRDLDAVFDQQGTKTQLKAAVRPAVRAAKASAAGNVNTGRYRQAIAPRVVRIKRGRDPGIDLGVYVRSYSRAQAEQVQKDKAHIGRTKVRWGQNLGHEYGNRKFKRPAFALNKGLVAGARTMVAGVEKIVVNELNGRRDRIVIANVDV